MGICEYFWNFNCFCFSTSHDVFKSSYSFKSNPKMKEDQIHHSNKYSQINQDWNTCENYSHNNSLEIDVFFHFHLQQFISNTCDHDWNNTNDNLKNTKHTYQYTKQEESFIVSFPDTIIQPFAMMIKPRSTSITLSTMLC